MRRSAWLAAVAALAFAVLVAVPGCNGTPPADPAANVAKIAKTIKLSAASATSIGLLAIPDPVEADKIGTETLRVLNENVFPILSGDEQGLVDGLARLRDLSVLDKPGLEKIKMILETALPLLESNLPDDLAEKATEKVPEDVKAYLTAFFEGLRDGCNAYLGSGDAPTGGAEWKALREKLAQ